MLASLPSLLLALWLCVLADGARAQPAPEPGAGPRTTDAAEVKHSEGQTLLVRGGSFQSPIRAETGIRAGDRIRTGTDGVVQLRFADGALMSIQPGSDFKVEAFAYDASLQRSFFELLRGTVRAVSGRIGKRDPEAWRLRTPTATLGIRGTEFTVSEVVCPKRSCGPEDGVGLAVEVSAGRVAVTNQTGSIEVPAGASVRVPGPQAKPILVGAAAVETSRSPRIPPPAAAPESPATSPAWIAPGTGSAPPAASQGAGRR